MPYADKEQQLAYWREYSKGEKAKAKKAAYYRHHRDDLIAKVTARTDPEAKRQYDQEHNKRPEVRAKRAEQRRAWNAANPEKTRAAGKASSARRRAAPYDATAKEYAQILLSDPCAYCGGSAGQIDHIRPLKLGGDSHWANLTAACQSCNYAKRDKPLLAFMAT